MTIKVAAGAVALAIAPRVKTSYNGTLSGMIKCKTRVVIITKIEAAKASKIVIIITLFPTAFKTLVLKEVPIENAINPRAI